MRPIHVTFTGLDDATAPADLVALSRDFPIEWGVLLHPTRTGTGRYPTLASIQSVLGLGLNFSAHLCGGHARDVVGRASLPGDVTRLLDGFGRIQVNTADRRAEPRAIAAFAGRFGARGILQSRGFDTFPQSREVDWLFDRSGGRGLLADCWPARGKEASLVGYSGGLGPDSVLGALAAIARQNPDAAPFWIDMEGAVRTDDVFDIAKCRRVCEAVYR